jgi:hypothetical protein
VLAVVKVPKHGDTVLSSGGSERSIGGNGEGVDVTSVAVVVGLELALGKLPDLERVSAELDGYPSISFRGKRGRWRSEILVEKLSHRVCFTPLK